MNWLLKKWSAYQRALDIRILWPACKAGANGNLRIARISFHLHMNLDSLYDDMSEEEKVVYVEALK